MFSLNNMNFKNIVWFIKAVLLLLLLLLTLLLLLLYSQCPQHQQERLSVFTNKRYPQPVTIIYYGSEKDCLQVSSEL